VRERELRPFVVLLRGVNVGPHKRIAMADLRALLARLGFADVRTMLQSGNAVVLAPPEDPAVLARRIEQGLADQLALASRCLVLTEKDLAAVVAGDPFGEVADNGSRYLATFLFDEPVPALRAEHDPQALDPERVRVGPRVIYQWCPDGILAAPAVGGFVEKRWKVVTTARNWNTVTKLATLTGG
jgi:uncharacterized protein (DUF1697 family)